VFLLGKGLQAKASFTPYYFQGYDPGSLCAGFIIRR
jgi:hypothetical protein